jgi:phospholipid/cholesterol/gamma-HCH transport system permease protein
MIDSIRDYVSALFRHIGRYLMLMVEAFRSPIYDGPTYRQNLARQMMRVGVESLPIVAIAAAFTGGVTTEQTIYQMRYPLIPESTVGAIVVPSIILEFGALITAFILAGRVSARIAAELGSMRTGGQIDALDVMGIRASGYLILPRVLAGVLTFPLLYIVATVVGSTAGLGVASTSGALTTTEFLSGARSFFTGFMAVYGIVKATVFGFLITSIACYVGYYTDGGAQGVGQSATQAAVAACIFILVADYLLAILML